MYSEQRLQTINNAWFYEGPLPTNSADFSSGSIDTSIIDQYRQGVELTLEKHFDAGFVKIYSGEPCHILRLSSLGQNYGKQFSKTQIYVDRDHLTPQSFVLSDTSNKNNSVNVIFDELNEVKSNVIDGVIEPLVVRERQKFFNINVKVHIARAGLQSGNENLGSDLLSSNYKKYGFYNERAPSSDNSNIKDVSIKPFIDLHFRKSVVTTESDIVEATKNMSSSVQDYMKTDEFTACTGFVYDFSQVDSLAFGGMTFKWLRREYLKIMNFLK